MLLRGRSKDRTPRKVTPPGPSYMSNEQFGIESPLLHSSYAPRQPSPLKTSFSPSSLTPTRDTSDSRNQWTADYLAELRNNRIKRPNGARPQPSATATDRRDPVAATPSEVPLRSESAQSHRRAQSAMPNLSVSSRTGRALVQQPYADNLTRDQSPELPLTPLKPSMVVPSATYIERGQRWMEKEEAVSLRDALEDMDLEKQRKEEEAQIHADAQQEASELVWQHENPNAVRSDGPYKYKEHLKKNSYAHARTQSVGRYSGIGMATGLARDIPRSVSGGSSNSGGTLSQSRVTSGSSGRSQRDSVLVNSPDSTNEPQYAAEHVASRSSRKPYPGLKKSVESSNRRRSGEKRNISGELVGSFTADQIWEEPEDTPLLGRGQNETGDVPAPLRIRPRNPISKVQFVQELSTQPNEHAPITNQKLSRSEIHQNPPSQSRNAAYTANSPPVLSTSLGQADVSGKGGIEIRGDDIRQATSKSFRDRSPRLPTPVVVSDKPGRPIVSFDANWRPKEADVKPVEEPRPPGFEGRRGATRESKGPHSISVTKDPSPASVPIILLPETQSTERNRAQAPPSIPTINCPPSHPPTISYPDTPMISVSEPASVHSISINDMPSPTNTSTRPLPDPKTSAGRPSPRHHATAPGAMSRKHWSPAVGNRATATCHQCQLPIEGRVVALKGLPERFHPHCFICHTCGTGLEALEISPEPTHHRAERLSRIQCRRQGELLNDVEGQTMADDGDERLRFYCHLDWHELFAPRCKHCKTPIIGEHTVALGEHWHYGHFFCAECGDPFEHGMTHIEKDGYAWCLNCQTKRTQRQAPKCKKCRGPVIGQYVQALGGEYHDECFRCAKCNGGFDDGQIFPRQEGSETVAICVQCMEQELKA